MRLFDRLFHRRPPSEPLPDYRRAVMDYADKRLREGDVSPKEAEWLRGILHRLGPVPGSFGDQNSYGPGPCHHLISYPGCPKCGRF